jgi:hypothetical protein
VLLPNCNKTTSNDISHSQSTTSQHRNSLEALQTLAIDLCFERQRAILDRHLLPIAIISLIESKEMTCSNLAEVSKCRRFRWGIMTLLALPLALAVTDTSHRHTPTRGWMKSQNGRRGIMLKRCSKDLNHHSFSPSQRIAAMLRGGADDDDESTDVSSFLKRIYCCFHL